VTTMRDKNHPKKYWRSVDEARTRLNVLDNGPKPEFPAGANELVVESGASRRKFMGMVGASAAIAGSMTTGCIRKPVEHILPFAERPEDRIPGVASHYATAFQVGSTVMGLLVQSTDGRPTKIEGNPSHSGSQGATDVWAQASVLNLYDPARSQVPMARVSAAYADAEDEASAKAAAGDRVCATARARAEANSKSVDRGVEAERNCRERLESARWTTRTVNGKNRAIVQVENEVQDEVDWDTVWPNLTDLLATKGKSKGKGLALVVDASHSPSYRGLLKLFQGRYPKARLFLDAPDYPVNSTQAAEMLCGDQARYFHSLENAQLVLAVDCDFIGTEQDHVRLAREFANNRKVEGPTDSMSRLYVVETQLTTTGAAADHRLALRSSQVSGFLAAVTTEVVKKTGVPSGAEGMAKAIASHAATFSDAAIEKYIAVLVEDLLAHGRSDAAVLVGERQPPEVQGIGFFLSRLLNASNSAGKGSLLFRYDTDTVKTESLTDLASALESKSLDMVICLDTNPAYNAPGTLMLAERLAGVETLIHAGSYNDETGRLAKWHLPTSHYLESWGDLEAMDFTVSIVQPLIKPIFETPSVLELLARIVHPEQATDGYTTVKGYWQQRENGGVSDRNWRKWLHQGRAEGVPRHPMRPAADQWAGLSGALDAYEPEEGGFEVNFHVDPKVRAGGAYSGNSWLQELSHPITKMVWDNAALISGATATKLGVKNGSFVDIKLGERSLSLPVWIAPGQAHDTISVSLGYGRTGLGEVATGAGFAVNPVRSHSHPWFEIGKVSAGSGHYELVSTQDYGLLDPDGTEGFPAVGMNFERRPLYRETTLDAYRAELNGLKGEGKAPFALAGDFMPPDRLNSLWDHPELTGPQQWGKAIDLNLCTGCNACVMACQAENNIPVVGKSEVANGREMAWIRIDRYYTGDINDPQAVILPVACAHCETAPCENVCPVQATSHSPEGLNDMAYNRCVGTRYCSNNCPYKVRRFNFYNYNREIDPLEQMVKNPDVTVRFRGVIEKCTYCVQRINRAKSNAHVAGHNKVPDGAFQVACQQACPTRAISFGDILPALAEAAESNHGHDDGHGHTEEKRKLLPPEKQTAVFNAKRSKREYGLLTDLNLHPRTTYLGRVRNPNPKLS